MDVQGLNPGDRQGLRSRLAYFPTNESKTRGATYLIFNLKLVERFNVTMCACLRTLRLRLFCFFSAFPGRQIRD